MENVLLVVHLLVAVVMILLILIQRTAQDGGGLAGGGGTMGGVFTARGGANALSRATAILATIFIITSMALTMIASHKGAEARNPASLIDGLIEQHEAGKPVAPAPEKPAEPQVPSVPMAK